MALTTRPELFDGAYTRIETTQLTRASRLLTQCTGTLRRAEQGHRRGERVLARGGDPPGRRAEASRDVRDHDAGVRGGGRQHAGAGQALGAPRAPASGSRSWATSSTTSASSRCSARFKELCDRKKFVDDRDISALATTAHDHAPARWTMVQMQVQSGTQLIPTATVRLRAADGTTKVGSGTGDGPVDASCRAIDAVVGEAGELQGFTTRSVSEGTGALAEVTVRVKDLYSGRTFVGRGTHVDVVEASGEAYLDAVNRLLTRARRGRARRARRATTATASPRRSRRRCRHERRTHAVREDLGAHVVRPQRDTTPAVLYVDLHLVHEVTSAQAFTELRDARPQACARPIARSPRWTTPRRRRRRLHGDAACSTQSARRARRSSTSSRRNCEEFGVPLLALGDDRQGIVHVIGPEHGLTQPGMTVVCGDSHTSTHGAFGALAFGIGTSQVAHVLATQCLLQTQSEDDGGARRRQAARRASPRRTSSSRSSRARRRWRHGPRHRVPRLRRSARCRWKSA